MKPFNILKIAALAVGLSAPAAQAASVDFTVSGATAVVTDVSPDCILFLCSTVGAVATVNPGIVGDSFSLAEGGSSYEFDFFDLSVDGLGTGNFAISASLDFTPPGGGISDTGGGAFGTLFGFVSGGYLNWDNPVQQVSFGNGGLYTVVLEDGVAIGFGDSATISAYVSLDVAPVPLPASALLLLAGIGGLGALRARKKAA